MAEDRLALAFEAVGADVQPVEDGLVHQPAEHGVGREIGLVAAPDDGQGLVEGLHDVAGFVGGGLDELAGLGALGFDALLLGLENLLGDGLFVVELDELLLLILEGS
jgi:hypothetical protein